MSTVGRPSLPDPCRGHGWGGKGRSRRKKETANSPLRSFLHFFFVSPGSGWGTGPVSHALPLARRKSNSMERERGVPAGQETGNICKKASLDSVSPPPVVDLILYSSQLSSATEWGGGVLGPPPRPPQKRNTLKTPPHPGDSFILRCS